MKGERDEPQAGPPRRPERRYSKHVVQPEAILEDHDAVEDVEFSGGARSERYPERDMPIAGAEPRAEMWATEDEPAPEGDELEAARDRYELFSEARERLLINYRHNTARAYWGDLDDIFFWCEHRGFDVFELNDAQFREYQGLMRRRKYSENTIRRRQVTYRLLRRVVDAES